MTAARPDGKLSGWQLPRQRGPCSGGRTEKLCQYRLVPLVDPQLKVGTCINYQVRATTAQEAGCCLTAKRLAGGAQAGAQAEERRNTL